MQQVNNIISAQVPNIPLNGSLFTRPEFFSQIEKRSCCRVNNQALLGLGALLFSGARYFIIFSICQVKMLSSADNINTVTLRKYGYRQQR